MSTNYPPVAILIPTYKQSIWIRKAVESALGQDYPNKVIWVLDDASPDNTQLVLQDWISSGTIQYIRAEQNIGRVANYRRGLHAAEGADWVINLDGDDYFTNPQFISIAVARIQAIRDKAVLFYQGVNLYGGDVASARLIAPQMKEEEKQITGRDYILHYFKRNAFSHLATLYRRDFAMQVGFYQQDILSTDLDSMLRLCFQFPDGQVIVSKEVAGLWVQHPANASRIADWKSLWVNQQLFPRLAKRMLSAGWSKPDVLRWKRQSYQHFWCMFLGNRLRKWGIRS